MIRQCPRKYVALHQIDDLAPGDAPVQDGWGMAAGTAFHRGVANVLSRWESNGSFSLREARGIARDYLEAETGLNSHQVAEAQALVGRALHAWAEMIPAYLARSEHIEIERAREFSLDGFLVAIRPDLVLRTKDQKTFVFDWKLGTGDFPMDRIQMECYLVALSMRPESHRSLMGSLIYFPKGKMRPVPWSDDLEDVVLRFIKETATYIDKEIAWESIEARPAHGLCSACAVNAVCPDALLESG